MLSPKSNEDLLSYLREDFIPIYRHHFIQPHFWEGPLLSEFVTVYYNSGSAKITFLSFPEFPEEIDPSKSMCSFEKIK